MPPLPGMLPESTAVPYLDARTLLRVVDWRIVADLAYSQDGPRPTRMSLIDQTRDTGQFVFEHLMAACGQLESCLVAGGRYCVADLQRLNNTLAGGIYLRRICGALTVWSMAWSREPGSADPDHVPGAKAALAVLEQLRKGETILPFVETARAGAGQQAVDMGDGREVAENRRYFEGANRRGCW
jgi:hypothetical protein